MGVAAVLTDNILERAGTWIAVYAGLPWNLSSSQDQTEPPFRPSNLTKRRAGVVARFGVKQTSQFGKNLSSPASADSVVLINHNLNSGSSVWLYGANSLNGPWSSRSIITTDEPTAFAALPETWTFRYWRLIVDNPSTVDGRPFQLGEWWLGQRVELPGFVWGAEVGRHVNDSFQESEYGAVHAYFLSERRSYRGTLHEGVTAAEKNVVENIKKEVQGRVHPFIFIPDVEGVDAMLGRFTEQNWSHRLILPGRVDGVDFSFTEDPWGKTGA